MDSLGIRKIPRTRGSAPVKSRCTCHSHGGFLLSPEGDAQQFSLEGLTDSERSVSLDIPVSVSALFEFELNDKLLDEQYRRFHNGS